jgi:WD40 repeat protein
VDNKLVRSLGPESYEAVSLAFSRDRDYLVSSHANDKCIKIWRVKTGELVFKEALPDVLAQVAATRNGLYLVGRAQAPACRITIWEFPKLPEN